MSNKNSSEAEDTLKLSVPKASRPAADETRVYNIPKQHVRAANSARPNAKPLRPSSAAAEHPVSASSSRHTSRTNHPNSETSEPKTSPNKNRQIKPTPDSKNKPAPDSSVRKSVKKAPAKPSEKTAAKAAKPVLNEDSYREPEVLKGKAKRKHGKKRNPVSVIIKSLIALFLVIFVIYSAVMLSIIRKVTPLEKTGQYQNDMSTLLYSSDVKNILVIGTDARNPNDRGLSDSMILVSLNGKNNKIQMTSFMRDMYTEIDGYDYDKLNAAYSYGGAELLIDTIEDNFKIRIDSCVAVNFLSVAYMIDSIGGIEIELSSDEADEINTIMFSEVNEILGDERDADFLPVEPGKYKLNGKQALSYSRIRHVGDADFERTQRQRKVITEMIHKMKKVNPFSFTSHMKKAATYVASDMDTLEMYSLSLKLPYYLLAYDIEQMRVPIDGSWDYDVTWDDQSILSVDFAQNTEYLKEQIYHPSKESKKKKKKTEPAPSRENPDVQDVPAIPDTPEEPNNENVIDEPSGQDFDENNVVNDIPDENTPDDQDLIDDPDDIIPEPSDQNQDYDDDTDDPDIDIENNNDDGFDNDYNDEDPDNFEDLPE